MFYFSYMKEPPTDVTGSQAETTQDGEGIQDNSQADIGDGARSLEEDCKVK